MTEKQILIGKILTNRIKTAKANGITDFSEIQNSIQILLAGGSITAEQYTELESLIS